MKQERVIELELRVLEDWQKQRCNGCISTYEVKELVVNGIVVALCRECRKELYDILVKDMWG